MPRTRVYLYACTNCGNVRAFVDRLGDVRSSPCSQCGDFGRAAVRELFEVVNYDGGVFVTRVEWDGGLSGPL